MIKNINIRSLKGITLGIVSEGVSYGNTKSIFSTYNHRLTVLDSGFVAVDGVELPNQILIEGISYAPIRASLNQFNHEVGWSPEEPNTVIILPDGSGIKVPQTLVGIKIAIDKGHGGIDPGAVSGIDHLIGDYLYTEEEKINCILRDKLIKQLELKGAQVLDVVPGHSDAGLTERSNRANNWGADYFLSIHNNAAHNRSAYGSEIFCASTASQGFPIATNILKGLSSVGIETRSVKVANFTVLHKTSMPANLFEGGFITNIKEERLLNDMVYLDLMAEAITKGIENSVNLIKR